MSGLGEWEFDVDDREGPNTAPPAAGAEEEAPPLYYGSVDEFVREMIVRVFGRKVGERSQFHWSAEWWKSPEAVIRLEALWRAWEHLRLDPATGMSVWLRDHADHHLGVLFSDHGPFAKATDESGLGAPLPYTAPPRDCFPTFAPGADSAALR